MKLKRIITVLLVTIMLAALSGCGAGETQNQIDELQARVEKLEEENKELTDRLAHLEAQDNANLSKWQIITEEETFFISINRSLFGGDLTSQDLAPLNVKNIVHINGVIPRLNDYYMGMDSTEYALYAIQTQEASDEDLKALQEIEFVDYAWRNEYDYYSDNMPCEEKVSMVIPDYWYGFHGDILVTIDKNFNGRLFTKKDFGLKNIVSVEWRSYEDFKNRNHTLNEYNHLFIVKISEYTDEAAKTAQTEIIKHKWAKHALPLYMVDDFPGIEG